MANSRSMGYTSAMETTPSPARHFAPRKTGDASPLGQLEDAVMHAVWEHPQEVSVSDVHSFLSDSKQIAYTTIKTTMERLADKGILTRVRKGKAYLYQAAVSQQELERRIVRAALNHLVEQFPNAVASFFVRPDAGVAEDTLTLLDAAIKRRQQDQESQDA